MGDAIAFVGGRIFTGRRVVEALLVEEGRVAAAGDRDHVNRRRPTGTEVVDLRGGLAIPGLIDAHYHLTESALRNRSIDLRGSRDLDDLLDRVRRSAGEGSGPLLGFGWTVDGWSEPRGPTLADLDRAAPARPVALYRACGHVAVVNSAALDLLHLDPPERERSDERWGVGPDGRFNGILEENALRHLRPLSERLLAEHRGSIPENLERMAALGVTTVGAVSAGSAEVETAREAEARAPLAVRLRFYVRPQEVPGVGHLQTRLSGTAHALVGVKAITDGSLGARTAWLSEPYEDAPMEQGMALGRAEEIADLLVEASRLGLQPALHAIGDRALHRVLRLLSAHSGGGVAPRIEHASLVPPPLFRRLDHLRPFLVVQPSFVASDQWVTARLGVTRARWVYPFRTLLERGLVLAGSSDAPYDDADPWRGMANAAAPRTPLAPGLPPPPESLAVETAFQLYTRGGAQALDEPSLGSLEPGSWGDVAVLGASRLEDAVGVGASTVRSTWRGGRRVYVAPDAPGSR